jgi:hypothetical protein
MLELLAVLATVVLLAGLSLALPLLPPEALLAAGAGLALAGLALGVPTGLVYHLRLRAALRARAALPARWWLHPTVLHAELREDERRSVLAWFAAGGAGFVLTVLGCVVAALGVALQAFLALHALAG